MKGDLIVALLVAGVGLQSFAVLGVVVMRNAYDRLHYAAAATTFGPFLIAAAIILDQSLSEVGMKALLVALVLIVGNPVVTHATARAARIRDTGDVGGSAVASVNADNEAVFSSKAS